MSLATELVSSARRYRRVSGRALARAAGASQAGLVELEKGGTDATTERLDRLLRPLGYQVTSLPTRRGTAASAAEEVRSFLSVSDDHGALRAIWQLADDVAGADPAISVALCVSPPAPTGSAAFDALLAAVVDHLLTESALPRPTWLDEPWRTLDEPWDVEPVPALREPARQATSAAFRAHGIYLDPRELDNR